MPAASASAAKINALIRLSLRSDARVRVAVFDLPAAAALVTAGLANLAGVFEVLAATVRVRAAGFFVVFTFALVVVLVAML